VDGQNLYRAHFILNYLDPSGKWTCKWRDKEEPGQGVVIEISINAYFIKDCLIENPEAECCKERCKGDVWVSFKVTMKHTGDDVPEFRRGGEIGYLHGCGKSSRMRIDDGEYGVGNELKGDLGPAKNGCKVPCCGGEKEGRFAIGTRNSRILIIPWRLKVESSSEGCGDEIDAVTTSPFIDTSADPRHEVTCASP
jgi:hypothetical protein